VTADDMTFAERYGPWALIAGASDGTGSAFAHAVAERGVNVLLLARRHALLEEVASRVRTDTGVEARPVTVDLAQPDAFSTILAATNGLEVGMLMYNAGGDPKADPFLSYSVDGALALIQRNCVAPTQLCHHFGTAMQRRGRGGIVLVSSAAGLLGRANMVTYGATKAFDVVFGEALWAELHASGVDVLVPVLGATDTPALRLIMAKRGLLSGPDDLSPIPNAVTAEEVAEGVIANLANGPTWYAGDHVRERSEQLRSMPRNDAVRAALAATGDRSMAGPRPDSRRSQ
jgi:short-subunit dehydrogenase